ncbi:YifB family Mg chelatase-like AAA ATPase [Teredinibacter turnerae]|uniref:YifB family Mg chelatase-like AAA ATPase n=1 Tax=Teredinibacter turnerae TaxID=2426 RepID=UPI0005F8840B|nr:YifB family Mg chelatase-like AAA ATPase [Teredinibacter turnerae]
MSLAIVYTRAQLGIESPLVTVETHLSGGLPGFTIVGLPEAAVKESKDRVRSALLNSHFEFPQQRITVNLAPADLPKEGGRYDLAIALGILAASGQIPDQTLENYEFIGELALSGDLRRIRGAIPVAIACGNENRTLVLPSENAAEAALSKKTDVLIAPNLLSVCAHLHQREPLSAPEKPLTHEAFYPIDMADVKGQAQARRALEIAASGGHNLLFYGPPGTGKSMLASRLPTIMPPLNDDEALEVAAIKSVSSHTGGGDWLARPFRSPHHTSTGVALVGGGTHPRPGEISLSHKGVLFLDELPEFPRQVLEVLREPLESGKICVSRASAQVEFPARFQLIAAMNPCPCGFLNDGTGRCRCTPQQISRYRDKISGPLLDRIDLQIHVASIPLEELQKKAEGESSCTIRKRVMRTRARQLMRQGKPNAELQGKELTRYCDLGKQEAQLLATALQRLHLSARAYDRVLRVARTIADMNECDKISTVHVSEALGYRNLDRANVEPMKPRPLGVSEY